MVVVATILSVLGVFLAFAWVWLHDPAVIAPALLMVALHSAILVGLFIWGRTAEGTRVYGALGGLASWALMTSGVVFALTILGFLPQASKWAKPALTVAIVAMVWCLGALSMRAPRNRFLGFRTPRTLANETTWSRLNKRHGRRLKIASAAGLLGLFAGDFGPLVALLPALVVALGFLIDERHGCP
jgi:hypothetical protein